MTRIFEAAQTPREESQDRAVFLMTGALDANLQKREAS